MAQRVYDETMLSAPSVDGDDFSGQSGEARMQLRQRIETEAQGKATAVFQAELARGQAMLQYHIQQRRQGLNGTGGLATGALGAGAKKKFAGARAKGGRKVQKRMTTRRVSCHRCGNKRTKNTVCDECPHIYCQRCSEKMIVEHGPEVFQGGCPVCKELCCCGVNRSTDCNRQFHCMKKCLSKFPSSGTGGTGSAASSPSNARTISSKGPPSLSRSSSRYGHTLVP